MRISTGVKIVGIILFIAGVGALAYVGFLFEKTRQSGIARRETVRPYMQSPLQSPSGKYIARVMEVKETRDGFEQFWKLYLSNASGTVEYTDTEGFPAYWDVYWIWDVNDRFWLYNSDEGTQWIWERQDGMWVKQRYDQNKKDALVSPVDWSKL